MESKVELIHGTSVAMGDFAALISGPSGSGKSDIALRFLSLKSALVSRERGALMLVSDDQTKFSIKNKKLIASAPKIIAGKLEVRGIGILEFPYKENAELSLIVKLVPAEAVPRMLDDPVPTTEILGVPVPTIQLAPFEASAPLKLLLALSSKNK